MLAGPNDPAGDRSAQDVLSVDAGLQQSSTARLQRGIGLPGALSANVLNMIGVGPFLTIPLALAAMGGPQAMLGWIAGAVLCLCDGLVWAELGSRYPRSGGPYHYLLHGFGEQKCGRLLAFLYLAQTLITGPISVASGAVGFSEYAHYLAPWLTHWHLVGLAAALCLLTTALLCRDIRSISIISVVVTAAVVGTCGWIIVSGALHFQPALAFHFPAGAFHLSRRFFSGLGAATLIGVYDYGGYNNTCLLGEEIREPRRNIPRSVLWSIALVAMLYLSMNLAILGTLPWQQAQHSTAVVAEFMQLLHGHAGGVAVSILILIAAFGSVYAILLGTSRVPYTAAVNGQFPAVFARLHPVGRYPVVSLLVIGGLSALACLFTLADLIGALIVVQTLFQFAAQCVAAILLRRSHPEKDPSLFRMPLFPLPALVALLGWTYLVMTAKPIYLGVGFAAAVAAAAIYLVRARQRQEWPFPIIP